VAQTSVITRPYTLHSTTPRASPALTGLVGVRGIGTFKLPTLFPAGWDSEASQTISDLSRRAKPGPGPRAHRLRAMPPKGSKKGDAPQLPPKGSCLEDSP
jgi:hypothetical protein